MEINKNTKNVINISLIKVTTKKEHIDALYQLLQQRSHTISHNSMPSRKQHKKFVLSHPYRVWYLITKNEEYIGSIYILKNNSIGIYTIKNSEKYIPHAIKFILKKHKPLPEKKSVRAAAFDFNASPTNKEYISILQEMGAQLAQMTYVFKDSTI